MKNIVATIANSAIDEPASFLLNSEPDIVLYSPARKLIPVPHCGAWANRKLHGKRVMQQRANVKNGLVH